MGTFDRAIGVPVRTLKYERQSVHQYGIGFAFGTGRVLVLPHLPQCRSPSGQRVDSNHATAAASSGNMSIN